MSLMDPTASKIQQLQKAFAELESQRAIMLNVKWKELEERFHGLERSLKRRFHELEDQEKEFEAKTRKAQEILEQREAAVMVKEQSSLERLQKKRDAAVFAVDNALERHRKVTSVQPSVVASDSHCDPPANVDHSPDDMAEESNFEEIRHSYGNGNLVVMSYPQLVKLCEEMDTNGLHKFISDNRKNLAILREELPLALKSAANPGQLVLNSLEDFYPIKMLNADGKKDPCLLGVRRTCIMLMECLSILLMHADLDSLSDVILEDVKNQAKGIAEEWKPKLDALDVDSSNGNSLEAHAFLQLLATFGIASFFELEELSRLIPMVSHRHQAADLCRFLGLSDAMPGVIEILVNSGKQIDAVHLAFAFELTERFSPIPLLKSYLKEMRKTISIKPGNTSPTTVQNQVNERELSTLKAVIKCVEDHKLEEQYPVEPLQKRLLQLEKDKADQKRITEAAKPQPKRPRANALGCAPRIYNVAADKTFYPKINDKYPHYVYERSYVYPGPVNDHVPLMGSATYNFNSNPSHGNYFGNGYHYQVPYLH